MWIESVDPIVGGVTKNLADELAPFVMERLSDLCHEKLKSVVEQKAMSVGSLDLEKPESQA
jgi:hypothetical protein